MSLRDNLNVLVKVEKSTNVFLIIDKQVTKVDKEWNENIITISYKTNFIDRARLIASSLSDFVDGLTEGIHNIKCNDWDCFLESECVKYNLIKYKCLYFNKQYSNNIDKELKKRFNNTFKFSNNDINKFILLLRNSFYP